MFEAACEADEKTIERGDKISNVYRFQAVVVEVVLMPLEVYYSIIHYSDWHLKGTPDYLIKRGNGVTNYFICIHHQVAMFSAQSCSQIRVFDQHQLLVAITFSLFFCH